MWSFSQYISPSGGLAPTAVHVVGWPPPASKRAHEALAGQDVHGWSPPTRSAVRLVGPGGAAPARGGLASDCRCPTMFRNECLKQGNLCGTGPPPRAPNPHGNPPPRPPSPPKSVARPLPEWGVGGAEGFPRTTNPAYPTPRSVARTLPEGGGEGWEGFVTLVSYTCTRVLRGALATPR